MLHSLTWCFSYFTLSNNPIEGKAGLLRKGGIKKITFLVIFLPFLLPYFLISRYGYLLVPESITFNLLTY